MRRALYGLGQAGRRWHFRLCEELDKFGIKSLKSDPCVFYLRRGEDIFLVVIYVDNILAVSGNEKIIERFAKTLVKNVRDQEPGKRETLSRDRIF